MCFNRTRIHVETTNQKVSAEQKKSSFLIDPLDRIGYIHIYGLKAAKNQKK